MGSGIAPPPVAARTEDGLAPVLQLGDLRIPRSALKRIAYVVLAIVTNSVAHYWVPREFIFVHSVLQHLYYIPIVLGAIFFGWVGGLITAICVCMCYVPHVHDWVAYEPHYALYQYAELGSFLLIGLVTGMLSDRELALNRRLRQRSRELAMANIELEKTFHQLKRASQLSAVGQIAAALAHEIRNPLASIEGAVQVLETQHEDTQLREEFHGIIRKQCQRLSRLLTELLNFAKPRQPALVTVALAELVSEVADLINPLLTGKKHSVRIASDDKNVAVSCDPEQMKQVLFNLLMNAHEATGEGGTIDVHFGREHSTFFLSVSDNGPGISAEEIEQIFEPFFTTKARGTGLGLSVVHQIVTHHGGEIRAFNKPDGGACFLIRIPLGQGESDG